jgi:hypothetical protein
MKRIANNKIRVTLWDFKRKKKKKEREKKEEGK